MGRTPKPLTILCHPDIAAWEEVQGLAAQGHAIWTAGSQLLDPESLSKFDLILHPKAWRMDPAHRKYLKLAVDAARKLRYPKEK